MYTNVSPVIQYFLSKVIWFDMRQIFMASSTQKLMSQKRTYNVIIVRKNSPTRLSLCSTRYKFIIRRGLAPIGMSLVWAVGSQQQNLLYCTNIQTNTNMVGVQNLFSNNAHYKYFR